MEMHSAYTDLFYWKKSRKKYEKWEKNKKEIRDIRKKRETEHLKIKKENQMIKIILKKCIKIF